jgi:hypothetical protein
VVKIYSIYFYDGEIMGRKRTRGEGSLTTVFVPDALRSKIDDYVEARQRNGMKDYTFSTFYVDAMKRALWINSIEYNNNFSMPSEDNVAIIAKTRWGKSRRVESLLEKMSKDKQIIIITPCDPSQDYPNLSGDGFGFETYIVNFGGSIDNELMLSKENRDSIARMKVTELLKNIKAVVNEKKRLIIYLKFSNTLMETIFVEELLTYILETHFNGHEPRLVVLEEAVRYDSGVLRQAAAVGLKMGLQLCVISQFPLDPYAMSNFQVILGYIWPSYLKDNPLFSEVAEVVVVLKPHEFLHFDQFKTAWYKLPAL